MSTGDAMEFHARSQGAELCRLGHHAWVPWLELPSSTFSSSFFTWCCRPGCEAKEQYDR